MKRTITFLLVVLLFLSCRHKKRNAELERQNEKLMITAQTEEEINAEYKLILDRIREIAHKVSEDEFNGKLSVGQFADRMNIALNDCKEYLISKLDTTNVDFEFMADTLWLNSIPSVLYDLELNVTTYGMMQSNKYHRELVRRTVDKYCDKLLVKISKKKQAIVKDAHNKWLKSIDSDYALASEIAPYQDGTMILSIWSQEVDDCVYKRIAFYYNYTDD